MNSIEKFYSDALKLIKKEYFETELPKLFCKAVCSHNKNMLILAKDFADYWLSEYAGGLQKPEQAVEWFYKIACLLDGSFKPDMDFSKKDWDEISLILSSEASETDMTVLNAIMSVIVERKKL